ncbi:ParA family protein [Ferrimonas lipolytica]|uniref:ParA family protein n=1 Tax=Ferrimonas lipolytica TaxID=2724191 RepID=A0A6H1UGJ6_9GAMM|nr:ParA family protein [Ferrimonas lipolytica]QIZ77336.1 ParA family protein [Ferrimonas lipolytica]
MQVWTVVNQKGGVGKTTTVVSLAGLLVQQGKRVLMIDTDPQGSLGYYLGLDPEELPRSLYDLFYHHQAISTKLCQSVIVPTKVERLHLMPASSALATLDRSLGNKPGMGFVLSRVIESLKCRYDAIIIDCPPVLGVLMINALACCQHVIVPVQTEYLALKGLGRMVGTLERMGKSGKAIPPYTIVPTMFDRRTKASLLALSELARSYPERLWHSVIPVDTRLRDASLAHLPGPQFAGRSRGINAYNELLEGLLERGQNDGKHRPASG